MSWGWGSFPFFQCKPPVSCQLAFCLAAENRKVSEYCSACVSHVGLSTKQATEPYSDNLLNRTRNPSEPYSDKDIPTRGALRPVPLLVGFSTGNPPKLRLSRLGTVHKTVLGHLLRKHCIWRTLAVFRRFCEQSGASEPP